MPYEVIKKGSKYLVVKKTDHNKVLGTHPSMQQAQRQIYAIEVNEGKGSK